MKQNVILSKRKTPAEIKVIYTELTEEWKRENATHSVWDWVTPDVRAVHYCGILSRACFSSFQTCKSNLHLNDGQESIPFLSCFAALR